MSCAAVLLVRDEADVIEAVVRHLLAHVDEVIVADNRSADGTREILEGLPVELRDDPEIGYWQDRKTTALAMEALERGHRWVLPCDADEVWHCADPDQRIADMLGSLGPDVIRVHALMFDHYPTADDPGHVACPLLRFGYRKRVSSSRKTAGRLTAGMRIQMGNHDIDYPGPALGVDRLNIRHFAWRSEEQAVRKVRNGIEAYKAAVGIGDEFGVGWRQWDGRPDEAIVGWFRQWAWSDRPADDDTLIFDPAPVRVRGVSVPDADGEVLLRRP